MPTSSTQLRQESRTSLYGSEQEDFIGYTLTDTDRSTPRSRPTTARQIRTNTTTHSSSTRRTRD
eukprot:3181333-Amphidinium_carterae.1